MREIEREIKREIERERDQFLIASCLFYGRVVTGVEKKKLKNYNFSR